MKRECSDYKIEDEVTLQKQIKIEHSDSLSRSTNEEDEARIINDFVKLCAKKSRQMGLHASILSSLTQYLTSSYNEHSMFPYQKVQPESFINSFCNVLPFKTLTPNFNGQELQIDQEPQENFALNQLVLPTEKQEPEEKEAKNTQSKYKNCYGLVAGRVIKSSKQYFKLKKNLESKVKIEENSRLYYIHIKMEQINDKKSFEEFLKEYHTRSSKMKRNRGKTTVYNYLATDAENGIILAELIQSFLMSENPDFQSYISKGVKSKKQIGQTLSDEKNLTYLRKAFKEMQMDLENL